MNKRYFLLFALIFAGLCSTCTEGDDTVHGTEREVELQIFTDSRQTRAAVPDRGTEKERRIDELDLLIFKNDGYQYCRRAYKISEGLYKANLKVDDDMLTAYVFANCRRLLERWETSSVQTDKPWALVQSELVDENPSRLISDTGSILPMWGTTSGYVSETQVSGWGNVLMLRSVASVDAYIEQNENTEIFILTDAHLYYAPDKGYLAPVPDGSGYKLGSPPGMETKLNSLVGSNVVQMAVENDQGVIISKDAVASQLYLFDNDINTGNFSPGQYPLRRYTRLILAGYYDQPQPVYTADEPGVDKRKKSYYPLDFVDEIGQFRPIKRNFKYVFNVTNVTGPGYGSLEEAADEYPIHLEVELIEWNREDIKIGVQGKYYLSMDRKDAWLWRVAGSTDRLKLTYEILDDVPGETFSIAFTSDSNGVQVPPTSEGPYPNVIANDYFKVSLLHDPTAKSADFLVEALQNYTEGHEADQVEVRFRNLKFFISITQRNYTEEDWWDGGEIPADL